MLGHANACREWLCGGTYNDEILALARRMPNVALPWGKSHSRCVGAQPVAMAVASDSGGM